MSLGECCICHTKITPGNELKLGTHIFCGECIRDINCGQKEEIAKIKTQCLNDIKEIYRKYDLDLTIAESQSLERKYNS